MNKIFFLLLMLAFASDAINLRSLIYREICSQDIIDENCVKWRVLTPQYPVALQPEHGYQFSLSGMPLELFSTQTVLLAIPKISLGSFDATVRNRHADFGSWSTLDFINQLLAQSQGHLITCQDGSYPIVRFNDDFGLDGDGMLSICGDGHGGIRRPFGNDGSFDFALFLVAPTATEFSVIRIPFDIRYTPPSTVAFNLETGSEDLNIKAAETLTFMKNSFEFASPAKKTFLKPKKLLYRPAKNYEPKIGVAEGSYQQAFGTNNLDERIKLKDCTSWRDRVVLLLRIREKIPSKLSELTKGAHAFYYNQLLPMLSCFEKHFGGDIDKFEGKWKDHKSISSFRTLCCRGKNPTFCSTLF